MAKKRAASQSAKGTRKKKVVKKKTTQSKKRVTKKPTTRKKVARKSQKKASVKRPARTPKAEEQAYRKHRDNAAKRARQNSSQQRDIGRIPPVEDPERRADCEKDLQLALETYFADIFALDWSSQHIDVIDALNQTLQFGGLFALGMPRGSGKTSLCIHAGLLAVLFGWRRYLVLLGAAAEAAYEMMDVVKVQLESNPLLLADFPEICYPIWQLEGIPQRATGQTVCGEPTGISWSGRKKIILPTTYEDGQPRGGSVMQAVGLLGRVRGMMHVTTDGDSIRPDAFLGDDLQTDDSAKNPKQVERRETLMNGAVMGLSGPGKKIAGLATVTIVRKGDLADRILDRKLNPHWHGKTFSLVERWPEHTDLWDKYAEFREVDLINGDEHLTNATSFLAENEKLMHKGAVVPWSARFDPGELSALQHAYNLKLRNPTTFDAEYQNAPLVSNTVIGQIDFPSSDDIVARVSGYEKRDIPDFVTRIFTAIDVQQDVLFWIQLGLADDFTGLIFDYGAYPEQPLGAYWTLADTKVSLRSYTEIPDIQGAWVAGLNRLLKLLHEREYIRDDGAQLSIDKTIIDANYGDSSKSVYSVCRQSSYHPLPFHGKGYTAKQQPIAMRRTKVGERSGQEWFMPAVKSTKTPRHVISDTNLIKTLVARRFTVPPGAGGDWQLYKASVSAHRMFADQCSSEYPVETEGRGRKLLEWSLLPGRDNHWLDCLVMAATLGLMHGCSPSKLSQTPQGSKKAKKSLQQLRAEAQLRKKKRK